MCHDPGDPSHGVSVDNKGYVMITIMLSLGSSDLQSVVTSREFGVLKKKL